MSQKIVVSKPGYNVLTETTVDNLIYSSDYDTLKYYASGSKTLSISSGDDHEETTITHSLGYRPFFIAYLELDFSLGSGKWSQVPLNIEDAYTRATITVAANTTQLVFSAYNTDDVFGDITFHFKYKIFRNDTGL